MSILNDSAYDIMGRLVDSPFDIIVSFSVMEHVIQRQRFLDSVAACLSDDGYFLINYDAGHFVHPGSMKERVKNIVEPVLSNFGVERYFQKFVYENDFEKMVQQSGMKIAEAKSFNTSLKGIHKIVPDARKDEHLQRWLD